MIFLKLGGSLITDKNKPQTPRPEVIHRLASEISAAYRKTPTMQLLLGHGSGSFGHSMADKHQTHLGASTQGEWLGFADVWRVANQLNRMVIDELHTVGLPVISFPPSSSAISANKDIVEMSVEPILRAFDAGLIPVVQGDVAFDRQQGSSIISTEQVFEFLAPHLNPTLILLAGIEAGVYRDFSAPEQIVPHISEKNSQELNVSDSYATDVTGGMAAKVQQALAFCKIVPKVEVRIFSGEHDGAVEEALVGTPHGTLVSL
jgi:isopentenyl phosphate kinase